MARFNTLADWLRWQEDLHPVGIDLGLERTRVVAERLGVLKPAPLVVSVAGTNGKGSTIALLEAMLVAAGYRVGSYISPHLWRYNERIRMCGNNISDREICDAFERVDSARCDISLTYFEFGTLAALDHFVARDLDVALLEVGLGGRLDAVNVVDADVSVITPIALDHCEWLGDNRSSIAREKAGIFRPRQTSVCTDRNPPSSLVEQARSTGVNLMKLGDDFEHEKLGNNWSWRSQEREVRGLPLPVLGGAWQLDNAAGALAVLDVLSAQLPVSREQMAAGLRQVRLPGRYQRIGDDVPVIVDVAHNPHSAAALARNLAEEAISGNTWAIVAMMADKDIEGVIAEMSAVVDGWFVADLPGERGARLSDEDAWPFQDVPVIDRYQSVVDALRSVRGIARPSDRVVVLGSFVTAGMVLHELDALS